MPSLYLMESEITQAFILVVVTRESAGIILLMHPSHNELIFDGLMSSIISEIKSLGGHTYNRPELVQTN